MNNTIKIVLGLNIFAGGLGIFFAVTKFNEVDGMRQAVVDAENKAQTFISNEKKSKKEKDAILAVSKNKDSQITNLKGQVSALQNSTSQTKQRLDNANSFAEDAKIKSKKAQSELESSQRIANLVPDLESQIASYENLGTPQEIKIKLDKLSKLETTKVILRPVKKKPIKGDSVEMGVIHSHNSKYGFYMVGFGSDSGAKLGDKFTVFRDKKAIGRIVIKRVNPTLSIVTLQTGFPKPPTPFKNGDKIIKFY